MVTLFGMLEMNKRSLFTSQFSLQTTNHNISNINNPGYSRQEVLLQSNIPTVTAKGILGNGVTVNTVRRSTAEFFTRQIREETASMGGWEMKSSTLSHLEVVFNEPSDNGLASCIDDFFVSWNTLASHPESGSARIDILESAKTMCSMFNSIDQSLDELGGNIDQQIEEGVALANDLIASIAELNTMIVETEGAGHSSGDYRDERDRLLKQLSKIVRIDIREDEFGSVDVFAGGVNIIHRSETLPFEAYMDDTGEITKMQVRLRGQNVNVTLSEGEITGLLESRDGYLQDARQALDYLASSFITRLNDLHNMGWTPYGSGYDFFSGTDASTIRVSEAIIANSDLIASSYDGTVGDNSLANDIVALANTCISDTDPLTLNERFETIISAIGIHSANSESMLRNEDMILSNLEMRKESITGVNLDEELVNLTRYQQSYEAAARIMTTIGELIDTILEM
ncbi:MAG: flagellar hook-associated protein FlgK [Candidatus Krumholzibacteriota bacterium]|nr:flagellar hook-associated protein FlgK [Candidatus Krumholzibacteriota bacterium]